MSNNSFSGSIPSCLRKSTKNLERLILHNNNFSGILPDMFVSGTRLKTLDVRRNHLQGKLPKSLINCKVMKLLNVESNNFKDKFPSWLGSVSSLNVIILRSNQFYGSLYHRHVAIGFRNLNVIDVSHNDFSGTFPSFFFSNWRDMATANAQDAQADDMYMKNPESIGYLKELRLLNLSGNAFTGNIPQSLANLTNLEALDISRNLLFGHIPQDLGILSFLSVINFSHNNLEGPIPRGTQFQRQNCSSFMDNPKLSNLEDICGKPHLPNLTPQETEEMLEPKEQVVNWIAAALAYGPGVFCGLVFGHIFVSHKHDWFS